MHEEFVVFSVLREFFVNEKKEEDALLFWAFLGPFFLLFTFAFLGVAFPDLWAMTFLGLLLCWKLKRRGCFIALFALISLALYQHMRIDHHLWRFAVELSLGLNLAITNFSLEHLFAQIASLGKHRANLLQNISFMEEEMRRADSFHLQQQKGLQETIALLQKDTREKTEKISSLELLMRTLKRALIEEKRERENVLISALEAERKAALLSYELEELKKEEKILKEKNPIKGLIDDLNALRQKQYQAELLERTGAQKIEEKEGEIENDQKISKEKILLLEKSLQEMCMKAGALEKLLQEKRKDGFQEESNLAQKEILEHRTIIADLQKTIGAQNSLSGKRLEDLRNLQSLYRQLQVQFKEKDTLLHQTRKELFAHSEKLQAIEKESALWAFEEKTSEKALIRDFIKIDEALLAVEEENRLLEEIVGSLSSQIACASLPAKKKRGRKKKSSDENQELLFKNS